MNVKIIYTDRIDSWDTRADGSASASHAVLRVRGQHLELWTRLRFDEDYDPKNGEAQHSRSESGKAVSILQLSTPKPPRDFAGWFAAAHDEHGVLRVDVDGETIYQYEEPVEEETAQTDGGSDTSVEKIPVFDPSHPTKAGLDAALKQKFGY